jgi:trehalose/maltose transport system substrate-binding protein
MRNWPYALELSQDAKSPVKDKVGVTVLPKGGGAGGRNAATLGGWNLGVSKFTKHPKEAAELALYLTGPEEQKRRAMEGGFHPTIQSLYEDPEVLEKRPTFKELFETFKNAVPRPSAQTKGKYNQASTEFWNAVHAVLTGQKKAQASFADLKSKLEQMSRGGRW